MTISRRALFFFAVTFSVCTGAAMYIGLQVGMSAAPAPLQAPIATAEPVAKLDAGVEECERVHPLSVEETAVPTATAFESESNVEQGDFATNSGVIDGSQFSDGGFGDIGQQWWNVSVTGDVITVNAGDNSPVDIDTTGGQAPAQVNAVGTTVPAAAAPAQADPQPATPVASAEPPPTEPTAVTSPPPPAPPAQAAPDGGATGAEASSGPPTESAAASGE
ncbi:MAG: hypothetical protein GY812_03825 [Actinomycetia bacterium]|nr:hypothetical protein [Actinomycetes bacterium]